MILVAAPANDSGSIQVNRSSVSIQTILVLFVVVQALCSVIKETPDKCEFLSLISLRVCVDVKQHFNNNNLSCLLQTYCYLSTKGTLSVS